MEQNDLKKARETARRLELQAIKREKTRYLAISITSVLALLVIWQLVVNLEFVNTRFFDSPIGVARTVFEKISRKSPDGGYLFEHIISSASVVWLGFLLAALIGLPLGAIMGWYRGADRIVRPLFEIVRPIPSLAWIPIVLLFLGIGIQARAVLIFFGCFVAIVLNTYTGIRSTSQVHINVAKTCGASNFRIFLKVGLPSAMPMIFAGLKVAIGSAWGTVVAAEMLAASSGLGYMIQMGRMFGSVSLIMAGIVVIGIMGFISSWIIQLLENIVLKWRPGK